MYKRYYTVLRPEMRATITVFWLPFVYTIVMKHQAMKHQANFFKLKLELNFERLLNKKITARIRCSKCHYLQHFAFNNQRHYILCDCKYLINLNVLSCKRYCFKTTFD